MWRITAPIRSCRYTITAAASAAPRRPRTSAAPDGAASHSRDVEYASAMTMQKKVCARQAWATETGVGSRKMTVSPPSTPWATTAASAAQARRRTPGRDSDRAVHTARTRVRKPTTLAAMRWPCS